LPLLWRAHYGEVTGGAKKLDQNRATSSIENGTMLRLDSLTRRRVIAQRGLAKPMG
jgi:hypothetical protein